MLIIVVLWPVLAADPVRLYLDPASRRVDPGDTFNVAVRLDTPSTNIGYVRTELTFPTDKLAVTRITTGPDFNQGSSPDYDNEDGEISLNRLASPSQRGNLLVATITFRTKNRGTAAVRFDGSSYAMDGNYRNQLTAVSHGSYTIQDPPPPPDPPPSSPNPPAPLPAPSPSPNPSPGSNPVSPLAPRPFVPDSEAGDRQSFEELDRDTLFQVPPAASPLVDSNQPKENGLLTIKDLAVPIIGYNSVDITWRTDLPSTSFLYYGLEPGATEDNLEEVEAGTDHRLTLSSLEPGRTYYFQIFATAGQEEATYQGEFTSRGFPVVVTILKGGEPVAGTTVTIGGQSQQAAENGTAYFELPAGELTAQVEADRDVQEFGLNVESLPADDFGTFPEEQNFTFELTAGGVVLPVVLLAAAMLALTAGGLVLFKRRRARRTAGTYSVFDEAASGQELKEPPAYEIDELPSELKADFSPLVNPVVIQPGSSSKPAAAKLPPSPSPVVPPLPPLPTMADSAAPAAPPSSPHTPQWQAEIQQELAKTHSQTEVDEPKDMFEIAEEQAAASKLAGPASVPPPPPKIPAPVMPAQAMAPPTPPPLPTAAKTLSSPPSAHHTPKWQAEIREEIVKKIPHDDMENPPDMFDTAEEQYHYNEKLKKPPKK